MCFSTFTAKPHIKLVESVYCVHNQHGRILQGPRTTSLLYELFTQIEDLGQNVNQPESWEAYVGLFKIEGVISAFKSRCKAQRAVGKTPLDFSMLRTDIKECITGMAKMVGAVTDTSAFLQLHLTSVLEAHDRLLFTAMYRDCMTDLTKAVAQKMPRDPTLLGMPEWLQVVRQRGLDIDQLNLDADKDPPSDHTKQWNMIVDELSTQDRYKLIWEFTQKATKVAHFWPDRISRDEALAMLKLLRSQEKRWVTSLPLQVGKEDQSLEALTRLYFMRLCPSNRSWAGSADATHSHE